MTRSLLAMAGRLACLGVTRVVMEATGVIRGANIAKLDIALVGPSRTRP
jgi:hypothetical protein